MISIVLILILNGMCAVSGFSFLGKEMKSVAAVCKLWHKQWVPIGVLDDLDPRNIHATTILGKDFIFYKQFVENGKSPWIAAEDRCPHRAAPLSEGYVNSSNGNIVCRYHGWQFDSQSGSCILIPQLKDSNTSAVIRSNPRGCLRKYPTCVSDDILWMYLTRESDTLLPPPVPTSKSNLGENSSAAIDVVTSSFGQENCRDYKLLMENSFDPSHASFIHHNEGFNRDEAVPMEQYSITEDISPQGFALTHSRFTSTFPDGIPTTRRMLSPYVMEVTYPDGFFLLSVTLMVIPVRPGFSRTFFLAKSKVPKLSPRLTGFKFLRNVIMPAWLQRGLRHVTGAGFGDQDVQDAVLQVKQQLRIQEDEAMGIHWQQGWFMPAIADVGVSSFHRWFGRYSLNGTVPWMDLNLFTDRSIPPMSEQMVLDRYTRHTKNCYSCQRTLQMIDQVLFPATKVFMAILATLVAWDSISLLKAVAILPKHLLLLGLKALALWIAWKAKQRLEILYKLFFTGPRPFKNIHGHPVF